MVYFPSLSRQTWPHDPQELDAFYGDPRGLSGANPAWETENLVPFMFPWHVRSGGQSGRIHRKVKPSLDRVLAAIWNYVGHDQTKIDAAHLSEFGGSYVFRANRNNPTALSNHARGIAIDLAPEENPNRAAWVDDGKHLPRFVIEAFKQEGWRWGGDFSGVKDAMHFEAVYDQHHDQEPVPAPKQMTDDGGQRTEKQPPASVSFPESILDLGEELAGLLLRKLVLDRTGIPAELDRFKARQLAALLVTRAQIDAAIAALQGFTLTPTAPGLPLGHATLPLPDISGLLPHAAPTTGAPVQVVPAPGPMQKNITATVFGGSSDPNESAYDGHVIGDSEPGCALPFHFASPPPRVVVTGPKGSATVPIVDVGPWNTNDPYWQSGARPQAESGADMRGRPTNRAGIDLTPATARAVGIAGKGTVDWCFDAAPHGASAAGTQGSQGEMQMSMPGNTNPPQIPAFLVNWKTSAAGAIPILLACVDILQMISSGHFDQTHLYADLGAFAAGFGLVGAQDSKK